MARANLNKSKKVSTFTTVLLLILSTRDFATLPYKLIPTRPLRHVWPKIVIENHSHTQEAQNMHQLKSPLLDPNLFTKITSKFEHC
jgi:hypothetical protein